MATAQASLMPKPSLVQFTEIEISEVVFRQDLYARGDHNPALVQEYAEVVDLLPAIEINQNNCLIDGRHRLLAHQEARKSTIKVKITETNNDREVYLLSVERNARHGRQLTRDEKRDNAIRMYDQGLNRATIQRYLAISAATLSGWFQHKDRLEREARENRIIDLWLACYTNTEIAAQIGTSEKPVKDVIERLRDSNSILKKSPKVTFSEPDWAMTEATRQYNVWRFKKSSNQVAIFGQSEQTIFENLLYLYTAPLDLIVDPFAGGGSSIDVCRKRIRRYWASDLYPIPARSGHIRQLDCVKDLPALHNRWSEVSLSYLDPPYWKQAEGKYSDDPRDLSNMSLKEYTDSLAGLIRRISEKQSHGVIALLISPTQYAAPDRQFTDHAFDVLTRVQKIKKFKLENRVSCPYNSHVYQNMLPCMKWAKENGKILSLTRELLIWKFC